MENKKKILIFSTTYDPFVGGAEVAIKEITSRLNGFDFDMITLRFDKNLPRVEKIGNVNVYRVGFSLNSPKMSDLVKWPLKINKFLFPFFSYWRARVLNKEKKYDAIWAMMASFSGFGALFFKLTHKNIFYILSLQEGDPIPEIKNKVRFIFPIFKKIFTKANKIQVISTYLGNWAKEMGGKNIEIIPNAANFKLFSQIVEEEELLNLKRQWGSEDDKFIITTSRLVKKNAINDVIEALVYLSENIKFIILGVGPEKTKLEKLVQKLGVKDRVKFLNFVDYGEIPKYLKASDIFIRPSLSEGFGNSFVEAMASEIPVIATPVGGIVDFLKDRETGLFCKVQNPEDISQKIKELLEDENLKNRIIQNAKEMVEKKYDWDIIAQDMKNKVFNKLTETYILN